MDLRLPLCWNSEDGEKCTSWLSWLLLLLDVAGINALRGSLLKFRMKLSVKRWGFKLVFRTFRVAELVTHSGSLFRRRGADTSKDLLAALWRPGRRGSKSRARVPVVPLVLRSSRKYLGSPVLIALDARRIHLKSILGPMGSQCNCFR